MLYQLRCARPGMAVGSAFAKALKVSESYVSALELDRKDASDALIDKISKVLDLSAFERRELLELSRVNRATVRITMEELPSPEHQILAADFAAALPSLKVADVLKLQAALWHIKSTARSSGRKS